MGDEFEPLPESPHQPSPDGFQLRDYQIATLEALRDGFRAGHRVQVLYLPTGGGKTETAIELLRATAEKYNRAAMVMDRRVLCDQTSERLDKYKVAHGVLMAQHWRYRPYEYVQICTAQTIEKRGAFPGLKLLIVDECHDQRKQTIEFIKNNPDVRVIGLSATPFTKGLGNTYSNVVCAATTEQLVGKGMLVPLKVFIAKEIDMTDAKKVAGEWSTDDAAARGMQITGDVVSEWVKKTTEFFGGPRKTIVFCANVAHGADLAQKFSEAGFNFVAISHKDTDEFKAEAVAEFRKPDSDIHGLIACDILTKGFDVPDVMVGVSARPFSKSLSSHVQQLGRIMRPFEGKTFALWLDHAGNYLRFREEWEQIYSDGVSAIDRHKEKPKKEKTEHEKEASKCPSCGHLWPGKTDTCPHCGFTRMKRSDIVSVPGELCELGDSANEKFTRETKQRWYSQLLCVQLERGYQSGWTAHKFREKFGVWPRGLDEVPVPTSLGVLRWLKSRQIAWAKARQSA